MQRHTLLQTGKYAQGEDRHEIGLSLITIGFMLWFFDLLVTFFLPTRLSDWPSARVLAADWIGCGGWRNSYRDWLEDEFRPVAPLREKKEQVSKRQDGRHDFGGHRTTPGKTDRVSFETITAAQAIAAETGWSIEACVVGSGIGAIASEIAGKKLGKVYALESTALAAYTPDGYSYALKQFISDKKPQLVLMPHTYQVRDFIPQ